MRLAGGERVGLAVAGCCSSSSSRSASCTSCRPGLGLFARLAPPRLGATTVAAWFLAIFSGSLLAGAVGALWSRTSHAGFFVLLSGLALVAAGVLWFLDRPIRNVESARRDALSDSDAGATGGAQEISRR